MTVRFTTTGPAGRGRQYVVWLFAGKGHEEDVCYSQSAAWDIAGGVGKTYEVVLDSEEFYEGSRFCTGGADLVIWTADANHENRRRDDLRTLHFRIRPSQSG